MKSLFLKRGWLGIFIAIIFIGTAAGILITNYRNALDKINMEGVDKHNGIEVQRGLKEFVEYTLGREFSRKTNNNQLRIREVSACNGILTINLNGNDNFVNKLILDGMDCDSIKILKALAGRNDISKYVINEYMLTADVYGKVYGTLAYSMEISKEKADKIVWQSFPREKFREIADSYIINSIYD